MSAISWVLLFELYWCITFFVVCARFGDPRDEGLTWSEVLFAVTFAPILYVLANHLLPASYFEGRA